MNFNFLFKSFFSLLLIVLVISCDKDINEIGSGILGDEHYGMDVAYSNVTAYNQILGPVQTNNLNINQFGFYNSPIFGKTTASFVSQVTMAVENPTFYTPVIDSVYLYVPYFSKFVSTDDSGNSTYTLDSLKGSGKIKLSVYESTKFLESLDPTTGFQQLQKYYSNQQVDFDANNGGVLLNNDNKSVYDHTVIDNSQNEKFVFSEKQIKFYKKNSDGTPGYTNVAERKAPGMLLNLDKAFFTSKILQAPAGKLYNNNTFKTYFKGLYFKVENAAESPNQGTLAMMNFTAGVITIVYRDKVSSSDTAAPVRKIMNLNLAGNCVNLLNNENSFPGFVTPNPTNGDRNLFLKGGDGSMAIIDLFDKTDNISYDKTDGHLINSPNGVSDELDNLRNPAGGKQKWLINDANLTFFINKNAMTNAIEPNRIFLYDLTNKRPIIDFFTDFTTSFISSKYSKLIYGGILSTETGKIVNAKSNERGTFYKVNITNHIRNLIKYGGVGVTKDSTNVRLGLVVTENINVASNFYLKNPFSSGTGSNLFQSKYIPAMSIANPLGTVLYGSNIPAGDSDYDKRIKLQIYYTKPE
jgi:hypothetical protein